MFQGVAFGFGFISYWMRKWCKIFQSTTKLSTAKPTKCKSEINCVLNSRASGLDLSPGRGHCVVFLGKTLYFHSASLQPGVNEFQRIQCWGIHVALQWTSIPSRGSRNTPGCFMLLKPGLALA